MWDIIFFEYIREILKDRKNYFFLFIFFISSCSQKDKNLFVLLDNKKIGIDFQNTVKNTDQFNIFSYRNFYNGGGVGTGDINNDGLQDVYFTANMGSNKLYLNKGNFQFEDITKKAGVAEALKWSTGVTFVDINHDGWLDIYVCNAGYQKNIGQENALFINNHDLTFTESAKAYGLDENGYTTHASFFDYDLDGDLDCYLLNNSFIPVNTLNNDNNRELRAKDWPVADFLKGGGDKLLRNDNGKFVDVSEEAGIYGSLIGFGLGVTVGDINGDNYPDIYVSNDFYEKDYLYINQQNGTFKESLEDRIDHTSFASMGADMADINNDGHHEIFATDMLPRSEERLKTTTAFDNHYVYKLRLEKGFYHQFMQNSLQLNNGDGTFSEVANYADVAATDWSWGALLFDADNDGLSDIFVSNGIFHDVIDQDFIDFFADELSQKAAALGKKSSFDKILEKIPSRPIANVFFKNKGQLKFEEQSELFGLAEPSFSNGAVYCDLDNDGDLDLIVNNVNQACFFYKNTAESKENHFLKVILKGEKQNTFAVGAKVDLYSGNQIYSKQLMPARGFQSSVEYPLTFGLGKIAEIDSMKIIWPNNTYQILSNLKADSLYKINYDSGKTKPYKPEIEAIKTYFSLQNSTLPKHIENDYEDFYFEKNIPQNLSQEGPKVAVGDLNGDGVDDLVFAGAKGEKTKIYFNVKGQFVLSTQADLDRFEIFEDTAITLFDADQDGDLDLYIGSGGNETAAGERELMDRLFFNNGKGTFEINGKSLPNNALNTSVVLPLDFDGDGDLDLFVGSRNYPKQYGITPNSFIYENIGKGIFKDVTQKLAPELSKLGLVRDAILVNIDGDKNKELLIVGDWMAPVIFKVNAKKFISIQHTLSELNGFWGSVNSFDVDNDGDLDLILGNMGENFPLKPTAENPMKIWINDFDGNGILDKILTKQINKKDVPVFLKREMMEQFPFLKAKSLKHSQYAIMDITGFFDQGLLAKAEVKSINFLKSIVAINDGKGNFEIVELPFQSQFSCINSLKIIDINQDGFSDVVFAGNNSAFIPQFGSRDAGRGGILMNNKGKLTFIEQKYTGLNLRGDVKQLAFFNNNGKKMLLAAINDQSPKIYQMNEKNQ
jgi:enediyne biosynthesis protein E4